MIIFIYALLGNLIVNACNVIATKMSLNTWSDIFHFQLKAIPLLVLFNIFFTAYFVFGIRHTNLGYGVLNILSVSMAVVIGILLQYFLYKQQLTMPQVVGIIMILAGIAVINLWK